MKALIVLLLLLAGCAEPAEPTPEVIEEDGRTSRGLGGNHSAPETDVIAGGTIDTNLETSGSVSFTAPAANRSYLSLETIDGVYLDLTVTFQDCRLGPATGGIVQGPGLSVFLDTLYRYEIPCGPLAAGSHEITWEQQGGMASFAWTMSIPADR